VKLRIEPATSALFAEAAAWRYPPPYDFYYDDGVPPNNPERYYSARDDTGAVVGWFYFEESGDAVFYGLGMRPDLTGQGLGLDFVRAGIDFAEDLLGRRRFVLDVAEFNERALRVYERAGFRTTGSHLRSFERWGDVRFIDMERPA
jgi:RimJ/RimL family protein N-acetyltransferase